MACLIGNYNYVSLCCLLTIICKQLWFLHSFFFQVAGQWNYFWLTQLTLGPPSSKLSVSLTYSPYQTFCLTLNLKETEERYSNSSGSIITKHYLCNCYPRLDITIGMFPLSRQSLPWLTGSWASANEETLLHYRSFVNRGPDYHRICSDKVCFKVKLLYIKDKTKTT